MLMLVCVTILAGCTSKPKQPEKEYPVTVGNAVEKTVPIYIEAIGNVFSFQNVQIRPQVSGIITEAFVKDGQNVKKGDKLYQIDPRPYQATLEKAKAQLIKDKATLEFNRIQVERNKTLTQQDFVSKITFEQYQSQVNNSIGQVQSDEADIATAELNLEWSTVVSPLDGRVSQTLINVGNLVILQDPNAIINIQQMTPVDIRFNITQKDFIEVQKAIKSGELKFEVILPQIPKEPRKGEIYFIDNHIDSTTGTILLKGSIDNEDDFLWIGEFVRVRLVLKEVPNAILVPEEAVLIGQQGPYVYIYKPETSTVEYRLVERGEKIDNLYLIYKGISLDDKVVMKGQVNLRDKAKVYLSEAPQASKPQ